MTTFRAMFPLIRWLREALTSSSPEYLSPQDIDRLAGLES